MLILLTTLMLQASAPLPTVARGANSAIDESRQVLVTTAEQWQRLWKEHAEEGAAPAVDFGARSVVAVFLGFRPTGGYSAEIVAARREGGELVVEYAERRPAKDTLVTQVLTSPFHMVSVPRHQGPVRFERVERPAPPAAQAPARQP